MQRPRRLKPRGLTNTRQVLEASLKESVPYETQVCGGTFLVHPNVFSPKYFMDTEYFARTIRVQPGEEFLEIGPGCGAISIIKALEGAQVTAVDINPDAVAITGENARRHQVQERLTVYQGDLYAPLPITASFDTIFWNVPFGYVDEDAELSLLERAVFDPGYAAIERYIREAKKYLKPSGRLMIGFSTTLGHLKLVRALLEEECYRLRRLNEIWSVETEPTKLNLFEARNERF